MLPGRGSRAAEAPVTRMQALVDELSQAVSERADKPYALFGHSMGALVAFELARRLDGLGLPGPRRLFVSSAPPPDSPRASTQPRALDDAATIQRFRELGGIPAAIADNHEAMAAALPALQASPLELVRTYQAPVVHCLCVPDLRAWRSRQSIGESRSTGRLEPLDSGELCHPHVSRRPFLSTAAHCCAAAFVRKRAGRVGTNSELKSSSHIANTGVGFDVADHGVVVVRFDDDRKSTNTGRPQSHSQRPPPVTRGQHADVVVVVSKHHNVFHVDAEVGSKLAQRIRLGGGLCLDN